VGYLIDGKQVKVRTALRRFAPFCSAAKRTELHLASATRFVRISGAVGTGFYQVAY
jgi:hypothetical protein